MGREFASTLRKWGTILYAKYGFGNIQDTSQYSAKGVSKPVYWFDSDSKNAGHCTPFNTILINKRPFEDLSSATRDYVFLHEVGHSKVRFPINLLEYTFLISALIFAALSPFAAITQVVTVYTATNSAYLTLLTVVAGLTVVIGFTSLFLILSWISEGYAELYSIKKIGEKEYLRASNEIREKTDRNQIRRIIHRIRYPPPGLVVWLSQKI